MKAKIFILLFTTCSLLANPATGLKKDLGVQNALGIPKEQYCHLYLVHHGDTGWTGEDRLQGWTDVPLNEEGRHEIRQVAHQLADIQFSVVYSSTLIRAAESAQIIAQGRRCMIVFDPALRGENHGVFEGLKKEEYENHPHYLKYLSLTPEEQIFFPVGEEGLSKADVARRVIPILQQICRDHPGENIIVVTHGGILKVINFLLGNYAKDQIHSIEHGHFLRLVGDGSMLTYADGQET